MTLSLTNALGAGQGRTAVRENFADIVSWANGANISIANLTSLPGARVYNNANISIPNNTATALTFNSERFDTNTIHDVAVNTNRLTCQTAGVYLIFGSVSWAANVNGTSTTLSIRLNGATTLAQEGGPPQTGIHYQCISGVYALAATNYVELIAYQTTSDASARNVVYSANASPEFGMQVLSP